MNHIVNCIDFEAQPLDHETYEIIEVGLTTYNLKTYDFSTYSWPVKPLSYTRISQDIYQLTGWTYSKLMKCGEPFTVIMDRIRTKYGGKNRLTVIDCPDELKQVYNNQFAIWLEDCRNQSLPVYPFGETINVSTLFKLYTKSLGRKNLSLEDMLEAFGTSFVGRKHRAGWDSLNIAILFHKITEEKDFNENLSDAPLPWNP